MSDKTSKMLERVRALLAKAADPGIPAPEADLFRQKADELMTTYAIEAWQVERAQEGMDSRPEPERRMVNFEWWRTNIFRDQLYYMFQATARHCRCIAVHRKATYRPDYVMPVFGLSSDLDWFDLLFTNLMSAMIQNVDPQPRRELTLMENLAMMREAGMPWREAIDRIIRAGETEDVTVESGATFESVYKPWVHEYRRWCRATGHPQSYVNQQTFRGHFADGFADEINSRLFRIRVETKRAYDDSHKAGGMELALRDIEQVVKESVWEAYPDLRPHPANCQCSICHIYKCTDPNCQRPACVAARKPVRARSVKAPKIDYAARQAGREAAAKVNLSNSPSERIGRTPELPS